MNKKNLKKGFSRLLISIFLCFIGPVTLSQAFKNEEHPFFLPVFFVGLFILLSAIAYGAWGVLTITRVLLEEKNN